MSRYKKIPTSREAVRAIRQADDTFNLGVFSTISEPDGDPHGDPDQCRMVTEYGFDDCDYPIFGVETKWERSNNYGERINEAHNYWLCVAINEDD